MKTAFKMKALSLAVLVACAPSVYAAKHNSSDSAPWYSMSSGYPMTFAGTVPTSNAWLWSPTAPVMPTNYEQFMV
ncbi:MAG TPA: hypothetical protein VL360_00240, partial [Gammaproteobacteria bacterium]|nr:hypothetical protein [Gammaproteobacteria bacterium]